MSEFVVGLTGGIGSGKSSVASLFADLGIDVIDADVVAREVVAKGSDALAKITAHFGSEVLTPEGELDRKALREIVFSQSEAKQWLNNLLHPRIREGMVEQAKAATSPYCIIEIPLLVENKLQHLVDKILVVDCQEKQQLTRTQSRDQAHEAQIKNIMKSQCSRQERLRYADDIIDNSGDFDALKANVQQLHQGYLLQSHDKSSK
ncbi:dephospho-CoA kinase [Alteromonas sp. a30]|uniref:dephospho-CoA kinase n=1 Tax=Alteromonas sp. a30 TaxID=2730917 RepID=UPI00228068BB|nr:dephospho-CoA kinase [Alteromonas sp. a30]MCY7294235.1 dephospho-CoA kinase [Alteromonas sp. a30]